MKNLAICWADETSEELKKFDFVFHIALKHVKKNSGVIEDIIIAQHSRLKAKKVKPVEIRYILEEDTSKVLLLLLLIQEFVAAKFVAEQDKVK